jgi:hypothetical protein
MEPWREVKKQGGRRGKTMEGVFVRCISSMIFFWYFGCADEFFWYFGCADEIASILDVQMNFFGILDVQMKLRISFVLGTDQ